MSEIERYDDNDPAAFVRLGEELERLTKEAEDLAAGPATPPGQALATTGSALPATQVKAAMAEQRASIIKKRAEIERVADQMKEVARRQMDAALEVLRPMQDLVRKLEEGIWTVNLYLGRDEEIVTLAEGEPAPADTPLTVRQMVLSMDQESRVAAEHGGIDAQSIDKFDEWITSNPAHLEQVLPERKGVVVLVPRIKRDRDYGDPWVQKAMDEANHQSYWLIRNGEKVYRMSTNFNVGKNLVPLRDEFTSFFRKKRYNHTTHQDEFHNIDPGSHEWLDAEEAADARQRHYMRIALILQGLIDRTPVFHPLPAEGVSFLQPESYDAGHVQIITDAELALGTGREPFYDWLHRLNAQLRPGMRVIGAFDSHEWYEINRPRSDYSDERRIRPSGARGLESGALYTIEETEPYQGTRALVIRFERSDKQWKKVWVPSPDKPGWGHDEYQDVPYEKRATALLLPTDNCILPFDLVTVEEMEAYMAMRTERHAYIDMVPLMKAAIAAKQAEGAEEEPFRTMLAGVIARDQHLDVEEVQEDLPALIDWWKLANRWHRPLVGEGDDQAKAVRMIAEEYRRRRMARRVAVEEGTEEQAMTARLREHHPEAMLIARKRDRTYVVLVPADERNVYVHRYTYTTTGKPRGVDEWVTVGTSYHGWRALHTTKVWIEWDHGRSPAAFLTGPERHEIIGRLLGQEVPEGYLPLGITEMEERDSWSDDNGFNLWAGKLVEVVEPEHLISDPAPLGPKIKGVRITWRRGKGGKMEMQRTNRSPKHLDKRDSRPWSHNRNLKVVWEHPENLALMDQNLAQVKAITQKADLLEEKAWALVGTIGAQWEAAREAEAYARFIEDYADPDLWEGHRKTLQLPRFDANRYGRRHHSMFPDPDPDPPEGVWDLTKLAVERGLPIEGLSVQGVVQVLASRYGINVEVPEDTLTLVYGVVPEPEPEEEDDDDDDFG